MGTVLWRNCANPFSMFVCTYIHRSVCTGICSSTSFYIQLQIDTHQHIYTRSWDPMPLGTDPQAHVWETSTLQRHGQILLHSSLAALVPLTWPWLRNCKKSKRQCNVLKYKNTQRHTKNIRPRACHKHSLGRKSSVQQNFRQASTPTAAFLTFNLLIQVLLRA